MEATVPIIERRVSLRWPEADVCSTLFSLNFGCRAIIAERDLAIASNCGNALGFRPMAEADI
jgi:hypothetical protein